MHLFCGSDRNKRTKCHVDNVNALYNGGYNVLMQQNYGNKQVIMDTDRRIIKDLRLKSKV